MFERVTWCRVWQQVKGVPIFRVLRRLWIPLVVFVVSAPWWRLRGIFGSEKRRSYADSKISASKPFNLQQLSYEVSGPRGTLADVSYFDVGADPRRVDGAGSHSNEVIAFTYFLMKAT